MRKITIFHRISTMRLIIWLSRFNTIRHVITMLLELGYTLPD